jgi:PAS domain S-box-containing protein
MSNERFRVLLVDENPVDADFLRDKIALFPSTESHVEVAETEKDALIAMDAFVWDLVFVDQFIGSGNGIELVRQLRNASPDSDFVLLVPADGPEVALQTLRAGAIDYLRKDNLSADSLERCLRHAWERRESRRRLIESNRRFELMITESLDAICVIDAETARILQVNPAMERMLGTNANRMIGRDLFDFFPPEATDDITRMRHDLRSYGAVFESQPFVHSSGEHRPMDVTATLVPWEGAQAILITLRDVSEREKALQALRQSEREKSVILDAMSELVFFMNTEYRILWCNRIAEENRGVEPGELVGKYCYEGVCEGDRPCPNCPVKETLGNGQVSKGEVELPGGRIGFVRSSPVLGDSGTPIGVVVVVMDITDQRRAERARQHLAAAVEQAGECILIADTNGDIVYVNPAFEKVTGYSKSEVLYRNPRLLSSGIHDRAFFEDLWSTIVRGEVWKGLMFDRHRSGAQIEVNATISPIRDESRKIIGYVDVMRDVTQERRFENQLRLRQKLESLGTLAGGIAHDFNNILFAVVGFSEVGLTMDDPKEIHDCLIEIRKAGNRAAELVSQILTFSRQTEQERKPLQLHSVVKEVLHLIRAMLPATIEIRRDIDAGCGPVLSDPTQIHQVVMNLCVNAYHAMRENGGVLKVSLKERDVSAEEAQKNSDLREGRFVSLSIGDTGCGMHPETIERLFEPYFTTKKPGEGTGLGLATVHGIVQAHEGAILVESEWGKGAKFEILFPICELPTADTNEDGTIIGQEYSGSERILVVDDEDAITKLVKSLLSRQGYRVETCTDSVKALGWFEENPQAFDLIILDQTMPGLTGAEMARRMLARRPNLPIILCTGFSESLKTFWKPSAGF